MIEGFKRRGAEPLYWEDVNVGDEIGPFVLPPWTLQDQVSRHFMDYCTKAAENLPGDELAFEPSYHHSKKTGEWVRVHPITRWPWTPGSEHEDALLAIYRGLPGPFDFRRATGPDSRPAADQLDGRRRVHPPVLHCHAEARLLRRRDYLQGHGGQEVQGDAARRGRPRSRPRRG